MERKRGNKIGKIYITGLGPGSIEEISPRAFESLKQADIIVGYKTYIDLIKNFKSLENCEFFSTGMTSELDRCEKVLDLAEDNKIVTLVCSGDAGVYGMAGILLERAENRGKEYEIEIIPGITASNSAAARIGAPLMHDYCNISLSDLLTPWEVIEKRLKAASEADFVIALYNPKSKTRTEPIKKAQEILLKNKDKDTPVGIVTNISRENEEIIITTLERMLEHPINMFSLIIVGNSESFISKNEQFIITPRGYLK